MHLIQVLHAFLDVLTPHMPILGQKSKLEKIFLGLRMEAFAPLALAGPDATQNYPRDQNAPDSSSTYVPQRFDTP